MLNRLVNVKFRVIVRIFLWIFYVFLNPLYFPSHAGQQASSGGMPVKGVQFPYGEKLDADTLRKVPAEADSVSDFDRFNKKMEKLFTCIPVPLYSYSTEAGHTFGLAKFNVTNLYKNDTVTKPSKISEVFTLSTEGRINGSLATELVFRDNKYILLSYINYKKTPEYIFGAELFSDVLVLSADKFYFANRLGKFSSICP